MTEKHWINIILVFELFDIFKLSQKIIKFIVVVGQYLNDRLKILIVSSISSCINLFLAIGLFLTWKRDEKMLCYAAMYQVDS